MTHAVTTQHGRLQIMQDANPFPPAHVQCPSTSRDDTPFRSILVEDERERAVTASALLATLSGTTVRVVQVGNPLRALLTLERILIQVGAVKHDAFREVDARLIVQAMTDRQGSEARIILLIDRAETLHPMVLHSLQAMEPHFVQAGRPTLQVLFVGHPAFLALLADEELTSLRTSLGMRGDLSAPKTTTAGASCMLGVVRTPEMIGTHFTPPVERLSSNLRCAQVEKIPKLATDRFLKALALASDKLGPPSKAIVQKAIGPEAADDQAGHSEQAFAELVTDQSSATTTSLELSRSRGGSLLRLVLAFAISMGLVWAAYLSLSISSTNQFQVVIGFSGSPDHQRNTETKVLLQMAGPLGLGWNAGGLLWCDWMMTVRQDRSFKGRHFTSGVILWTLRWYLAFPISYRFLSTSDDQAWAVPI